MNEKTVCSECGAVLTEGHIHSFDGQIFCEDCFNRCTTTCDNCGDRIWRDNAEGDSNYTLCSHCYEYSYTTCEDCGRLIHNEDSVKGEIEICESISLVLCPDYSIIEIKFIQNGENCILVLLLF